MKQTVLKIAFLFAGLALLTTCKKDYSVEGNGYNNNAVGTLLDSSGSCQNIGVVGTYTVDSILTDSNYLLINVNFTSVGKYKIQTDTVNGFWFIDSATILTTGSQIIKIPGYGKPLLPVNPTFLVSFNDSYCFFVVPITGASGSTAITYAGYSLAGAPNTCSGATVQGTYTAGTTLTSSNSAVIQVTVTSPGAYSISTPTVNGMKFTRNGIFDNTGSYAITLYGQGSPIDSGTTTIPITAGSSTCSFLVPVVAPAANTGNSSGSGGSTSTGSANTWQFNDGSQLFSGTDSATVNTVTSPVTETALVISGGTMTGDTTISLSVGILGSASIKTGTYTSSIYVINGISNVIYQPTTTGQGLQVIITSYNSNTKIVQGTFSGSVQNSSGATKNITGGSFNARIVN
jgi:hypothetical protein